MDLEYFLNTFFQNGYGKRQGNTETDILLTLSKKLGFSNGCKIDIRYRSKR